MEVIILEDADEVSQVAASIVADIINARPRAVLGLATGSSPRGLYGELCSRVQAGQVSFAQASGFALDEYVGLPREHPESYASVIAREIVAPLGFDPHRVHVPDGRAPDLAAAAQEYDDAISAAGGIDIQILGIGTNGHLGFNEPTSSFASRTRIKTLAPQTRSDNARFFDSPEDVPTHCVTQGLGTILDARALVLVAQGDTKAASVAAAIEGPVTSFVPASALQLHRHAAVVIDTAAASPPATGCLLPSHLHEQDPVMRLKTAPQTLSPLLVEAVGEASRIRTRAIDLAAYASDASHYLLTPTAVIIAQTADEVARILSAASRSASPVTLRSGGTSLSGQASGAGVLVDVRQHFRDIEVLDEGERVRVQPGATVAQVNARLRHYGFRLGPDPASEIACTIGGVVANNSSGMACGVKENTYQTLESMVFVLPSGTIINTAEPDANTHLRESESELFSGLERLRRRVLAQPVSVALIRRQFALKNTMGYGINAILDYQSPVDMLQHLIIGSEGTLAFVAEATFRTVPVLPLVSTALAVFPTLDAATLALPMLVGSGAATLELMDSTSISVGQRLPDAPEQIRGFIPEAHAALLIEYRSDNAEKLIAAAQAGNQLFAELPLTSAAEFHTDAAERRRLWAFRKGLYTSVAEARPSGTTALLEDIAVPVAALSDVSTKLQGLFERYGYRNSVIFGHAKDGNIHFMLTDRFEGDAALNRYLSFTESMVELVLGAGGNLKAEHGTGRVMAPYVRHQYGDELYEVMCDLKRLCDPAGIMNPGVLIAEDHDAHIRNIKLHPTVETEVDRCVDCGYCEPVCPSRDLTLTPRQRIGVRRATESARNAGAVELARELAKDFEYDGVQTCAVDGMCQTACPVLINTGDLVRRLRREHAEPVAATGWRAAATAWGSVTRIGSKALSVAHSLPTPAVRAVTDIGRAVLGPETMPRYSGDLPGGGRSRAGFRRLVGSGENDPVGVFVPACVNSMFGATGDGEGVTSAFVRLLEQAQIRLVIPDGIEAVCCGTPWSSKGFSAGDEIVRRRSLESIGAAIADSHCLVISDASSCTEGFARILAGAGAVIEDAVAFAVREIVPRLTVENRLKTLVLHPTCSSRQMGLDPALEAIGAVLAEDVRVPDNWGCCAFAGDRGMLHPELTASATFAEAAEVATIDADGYASCNRTCELGMTRATGKDYRHVLELLADMTRSTTT